MRLSVSQQRVIDALSDGATLKLVRVHAQHHRALLEHQGKVTRVNPATFRALLRSGAIHVVGVEELTVTYYKHDAQLETEPSGPSR